MGTRGDPEGATLDAAAHRAAAAGPGPPPAAGGTRCGACRSGDRSCSGSSRRCGNWALPQSLTPLWLQTSGCQGQQTPAASRKRPPPQRRTQVGLALPSNASEPRPKKAPLPPHPPGSSPAAHRPWPWRAPPPSCRFRVLGRCTEDHSAQTAGAGIDCTATCRRQHQQLLWHPRRSPVCWLQHHLGW